MDFADYLLRIDRPGHSRQSRKKFGFSEKSTYLASVRLLKTPGSGGPNDKIIDIHNFKKIAYREKSTLNYI